MTSRVTTIAFQGVEGVLVDCQAQFVTGQVAFTIVGLPDKAVGESRERVRAALHAVGLALPGKRLVINLSPADLPKEGSHYDLPIALALLSALGVIPPDFLQSYAVMGELALDGSFLPISGALPAAMTAHGNGLGLICPKESGREAVWAGEEIDVLAPENLIQLINHVKGTQVLRRPVPNLEPSAPNFKDLSEIKGQEMAKRALEVAAAGGHHMIMVGPPGAGKSMLAARLPSILPPMEPREMLDVSMIASLSGELRDGALSRARPFRCPHHSASMAALVGGGLRAKPGEMALAHHGVLFLDELPEFQPRVLESLRQPMESGQTVVARANYHVTYPASFQLIAAMNPCKCGMSGMAGHVCRQGPRCASDYQARISGPLLDRMDMQIELQAVKASDLALPAPQEKSADVAKRVAAARLRQANRCRKLGHESIRTNAQVDGNLLEEVAKLDVSATSLMRDAAEAMNLSARGYHRVLRVALTIADLDGRDRIARNHLAEALSYRQKPASLQAAA
jgi:magnesium chelatase family protein